MRIIKKDSRQGQNMRARASVWEGVDLCDVYDNPSPAKVIAFMECVERCAKEGGWSFHICSHNSFSYSVAWATVDGMRIETASNSYLVR